MSADAVADAASPLLKAARRYSEQVISRREALLRQLHLQVQAFARESAVKAISQQSAQVAGAGVQAAAGLRSQSRGDPQDGLRGDALRIAAAKLGQHLRRETVKVVEAIHLVRAATERSGSGTTAAPDGGAASPAAVAASAAMLSAYDSYLSKMLTDTDMITLSPALCACLSISVPEGRGNPLLMPRNLQHTKPNVPDPLPPLVTWLMQRLLDYDIRDSFGGAEGAAPHSYSFASLDTFTTPAALAHAGAGIPSTAGGGDVASGAADVRVVPRYMFGAVAADTPTQRLHMEMLLNPATVVLADAGAAGSHTARSQVDAAQVTSHDAELLLRFRHVYALVEHMRFAKAQQALHEAVMVGVREAELRKRALDNTAIGRPFGEHAAAAAAAAAAAVGGAAPTTPSRSAAASAGGGHVPVATSPSFGGTFLTGMASSPSPSGSRRGSVAGASPPAAAGGGGGGLGSAGGTRRSPSPAAFRAGSPAAAAAAGGSPAPGVTAARQWAQAIQAADETLAWLGLTSPATGGGAPPTPTAIGRTAVRGASRSPAPGGAGGAAAASATGPIRSPSMSASRGALGATGGFGSSRLGATGTSATSRPSIGRSTSRGPTGSGPASVGAGRSTSRGPGIGSVAASLARTGSLAAAAGRGPALSASTTARARPGGMGAGAAAPTMLLAGAAHRATSSPAGAMARRPAPAAAAGGGPPVFAGGLLRGNPNAPATSAGSGGAPGPRRGIAINTSQLKSALASSSAHAAAAPRATVTGISTRAGGPPPQGGLPAAAFGTRGVGPNPAYSVAKHPLKAGITLPAAAGAGTARAGSGGHQQQAAAPVKQLAGGPARGGYIPRAPRPSSLSRNGGSSRPPEEGAAAGSSTARSAGSAGGTGDAGKGPRSLAGYLAAAAANTGASGAPSGDTGRSGRWGATGGSTSSGGGGGGGGAAATSPRMSRTSSAVLGSAASAYASARVGAASRSPSAHLRSTSSSSAGFARAGGGGGGLPSPYAQSGGGGMLEYGDASARGGSLTRRSQRSLSSTSRGGGGGTAPLRSWESASGQRAGSGGPARVPSGSRLRELVLSSSPSQTAREPAVSRGGSAGIMSAATSAAAAQAMRPSPYSIVVDPKKAANMFAQALDAAAAADPRAPSRSPVASAAGGVHRSPVGIPAPGEYQHHQYQQHTMTGGGGGLVDYAGAAGGSAAAAPGSLSSTARAPMSRAEQEAAAVRDAALNARVNAAAASASALLSQAFSSISSTPSGLMPLHSSAGLLGPMHSTGGGGQSLLALPPITSATYGLGSAGPYAHSGAPGGYAHNVMTSRAGAPLLGIDGKPSTAQRLSAAPVPNPLHSTVPFALPLSLSEHSAAARMEASSTPYTEAGASTILRPLTSTLSFGDSMGPFQSQFASSVRAPPAVSNPAVSATGSVVLNSSVNDFMTRLESIKSSIFNRMGIKPEGGPPGSAGPAGSFGITPTGGLPAEPFGDSVASSGAAAITLASADAAE